MQLDKHTKRQTNSTGNVLNPLNPIGLGHRSQITEGRPFSYTQRSDEELLLQGALMFMRSYQLSS
jgi:hypothetical protein